LWKREETETSVWNLNDATKRRTLKIYNKHSALGYTESFKGFHIHVVVNIKIMIFLDVMPCSLKEMYRLKMETAGSSKMLVPVYKTIWHHIPEDCTLQIICQMYPSSTDLWIITWSHLPISVGWKTVSSCLTLNWSHH
jgi:hypothetical protein